MPRGGHPMAGSCPVNGRYRSVSLFVHDPFQAFRDEVADAELVPTPICVELFWRGELAPSVAEIIDALNSADILTRGRGALLAGYLPWLLDNEFEVLNPRSTLGVECVDRQDVQMPGIVGERTERTFPVYFWVLKIGIAGVQRDPALG